MSDDWTDVILLKNNVEIDRVLSCIAPGKELTVAIPCDKMLQLDKVAANYNLCHTPQGAQNYGGVKCAVEHVWKVR